MQKRTGKVVGMALTDQASEGIVVRLQLADGSVEECRACLPADGTDNEEARARVRRAIFAAADSGEDIDIYVDDQEPST